MPLPWHESADVQAVPGQVTMGNDQISATSLAADDSFRIGPGSTIIARTVRIGRDVRIDQDVTIVADDVVIDDGVRIGAGVSLMSPRVRLAAHSQLSGSIEAEFNEYFELGRYSSIGRRVAMVGQGFRAGEFLWMKEEVTVGGGGARGPRSYLTIGDHSSVFDRCFINLSEPVSIGSHSALSAGVSLLTHAAWQPALMGYATKFGPIAIGDYSVVYLNASVMPGVKIGSYATVASSSLVAIDVPDHSLAAGVPAVIKKGPDDYPRALTAAQKVELLYDVVDDYLTSLPQKGISVTSSRVRETGYAEVEVNGAVERICVLTDQASADRSGRALIAISLDEGVRTPAVTHFDLHRLEMRGEATALAEDFRDYLRRRAIRVITGAPYRVLPQTNVARLRMARDRKRHP